MPGKHAAERIVIVGASLAGLRAAQTLREEGFGGTLTIIGDEADPPYDRPPLSKQVLSGWIPADHTLLPHLTPSGDTRWLLGIAGRPARPSRRGGACSPTDRGSPTTGCSSPPAYATGPGRTPSRAP